MSTNGAWGYLNEMGERITYYSHYDSYPDALGHAFLNYLKVPDDEGLNADIVRSYGEEQIDTAEYGFLEYIYIWDQVNKTFIVEIPHFRGETEYKTWPIDNLPSTEEFLAAFKED